VSVDGRLETKLRLPRFHAMQPSVAVVVRRPPLAAAGREQLFHGHDQHELAFF
jgi:hypothetical protein